MYKNLYREDTAIIKRALKQYLKNNAVKYDEKSKIKRIVKELDAPERDSVIYAEFAEFMLKDFLLAKYTLIDKEGKKLN